MRLDELHGTILEFFELGAPAENGVIICIDGDDLGIDHVELIDNCLRIYVENK